MQKTQHFQSAVSVFLIYLVFKAAPITAVVYYFFDWQWALFSAVLLLSIIFVYSGLTNHHFSLGSEQLTIRPSLFFWKKPLSIPYQDIGSIEIKFSGEKDNRQWLKITSTNAGKTALKMKQYRCDWLHMQDPPDDEDDDHGHPEHELFELLEEEDFYEGSLEQLSNELQTKGLSVTQLI